MCVKNEKKNFNHKIEFKYCDHINGVTATQRQIYNFMSSLMKMGNFPHILYIHNQFLS